MHSYGADAKDSSRALLIPVGLFVVAGVIYGVLSSSDVFGTIAHDSYIIPVVHFTLKGSQVRVPSALFIFSVLYWIFDRSAWHWPIVRWWVNLPDVRGEWHGRFIADPESGVGSGTVYLAIRQQWRRLSVDFASRLDKNESDGSPRVSRSNSTMASLTSEGPCTLRYEYTVDEGGALHPHEGVAHLEIYLDAKPAALQGTYYTDKEGNPQHYGVLEKFERVRHRPRSPGEIFGAIQQPISTTPA